MQVDTVPLGGDSNSWVLTSEGTGLHNGQVVSRVRQGQQLPVEGDIIVSTVYSDSNDLLPFLVLFSVNLFTILVVATLFFEPAIIL